MSAPKPQDEQILAAIKDLGERMSKLEVLGNELVIGQAENAALIEALIAAIEKAPEAIFGGLKVEAPADLDLNSWMEAQKKKDQAAGL